uniref:Uncharacterized protein n=1 Tax=Pyrodinium bahamense TaxID=73915 RepID=A0A6T8RJC4_9DINO
MDDILTKHQDNLSRTSSTVEDLNDQVTTLACSCREHKDEMLHAHGTVKALSDRLIALDSNVREGQTELMETIGSIRSLSDQVTVHEDSLQKHKSELLESSRSMRSLAEQVAALEASTQQRLLQQPAGTAADPVAGRLLRGPLGQQLAALREQLEAEGAQGGLEDSEEGCAEELPLPAEVGQALERMQETCLRASQAVAAAAERELTALQQGADAVSAAVAPVAGVAEDFLVEQRLVLAAATPGCDEALQRQLQVYTERMTAQVLEKLEGMQSFQHELMEAKAMIGRLAEQVAAVEARTQGEAVPCEQRAGMGSMGASLCRSNQAGCGVPQELAALRALLREEQGWLEQPATAGGGGAGGGPAEDEAEHAEPVDNALLRLQAACLQAAEGIAAAARRELTELQLAKSSCLDAHVEEEGE